MTETTAGLILPFVLDNVPIRGKLVRLNNLDSNVPTLANARGVIHTAVAELLAAAATLMSELKNPDVEKKANVTLQIQTADGPVPLLVAHCGASGDIKAYAKMTAEHAKVTSFKDLATAQSLFAVTVDYGPGDDPWQSFVQLGQSGVAPSMDAYFNQSVQQATYFRVHVGEVGGQLCCGALFLQQLPHQNEEDAEALQDDWTRMSHLLDTIQPEEVLGDSLPPEALLQRVFAEDDVRIFSPQPLTFKAPDTRARMEQALLTMGEEQVKQMMEENGGQLGMMCEFTGREEVFTTEDIEALFVKN